MRMIRMFNMDCMDGMKAMPDKAFDLDWYELDPDYYAAAKDRLERHQRQATLFVGDGINHATETT